MTPRVSVIVPTRSRRAALERALESVNGQTYRDFEVIVVDDGSTDGTAKWIEETSPRVRLYRHDTPAGAAAARNRGLELATGELIAFLDDDDAWHPGYLEAQVGSLDAHPEAAFSYSDHTEVDASGRQARPRTETLLSNVDVVVRLLAECPIHTLSVVASRRSTFDRFGTFDESLRIVHDLDWYVRVGGGVHLREPLVDKRVPGGLTTSYQTWYREDSEVISRVLASRPEDARFVHAYRALYFGRIALAQGDFSFGLARIGEALGQSPSATVLLSAAAIRRRIGRLRTASAPP